MGQNEQNNRDKFLAAMQRVDALGAVLKFDADCTRLRRVWEACKHLAQQPLEGEVIYFNEKSRNDNAAVSRAAPGDHPMNQARAPYPNVRNRSLS